MGVGRHESGRAVSNDSPSDCSDFLSHLPALTVQHGSSHGIGSSLQSISAARNGDFQSPWIVGSRSTTSATVLGEATAPGVSHQPARSPDQPAHTSAQPDQVLPVHAQHAGRRTASPRRSPGRAQQGAVAEVALRALSALPGLSSIHLSNSLFASSSQTRASRRSRRLSLLASAPVAHRPTYHCRLTSYGVQSVG